MENLKILAFEEIDTIINKKIDKIKTEEGLKEVLQFEGKKYKKNPEIKILKFLESKRQKQKEEVLNKIESVKNAKDFSGEFIITIEWKKSYMWGSNPKAYTNYGFEGSSIGGCGYDKKSTSVAQALNSNLRILKLLYLKKEETLKTAITEEDKKNHKIFGYGSGYDVFPSFEGGVGVSCFESILKGIGLEMQNITSTDSTDVYLIRAMNEEEKFRYKEKGY